MCDNPVRAELIAPASATTGSANDATGRVLRIGEQSKLMKAGRSASSSAGARERSPARGQRRDALVVAAERLFSRMPYSQVEISDIADEAGVSHGLLFYHFKDKRGIYLAVLTKMTSEIVELWEPPDDETSPTERLRDLLRRQIAYRQEHPQTVLAMIRASEHDPEIHELLERARQPGLNVVEELLGVGDEPDPAVRLAVRGCMGFLDELTSDWINHGSDLAPEGIEELAFKAIVAALSAVQPGDANPAGVAGASSDRKSLTPAPRRGNSRRPSPRRGAV